MFNVKLHQIGYGLCLIVIAALAFWGWAENTKRHVADMSLSKLKISIADERQKTAEKIAELTELNVVNERKYSEQLSKANEEHKREIAANHLESVKSRDLVNRLHQDLREANSKLATASRTSIESYAATTGQYLGECTAYVAEVVELAKNYNSELVYTRSIWPKPPPIPKED